VQEGSTHAYLWDEAEAAAAVVRTIHHRNESGAEDGPLAGMSTRQLVAALMAGLGAEVGSQVIKHLRSEDEVRWVGTAVAEEPEVTRATATQVVEMVRQRVEAGDYLQDGGRELARQLMVGAFGLRRSRLFLNPDQDGKIQALNDVAAEQVAPYISHEHPQTIALLLSQLNPSQAAGILSMLPERMQPDVSYRMSTMENVTPDLLNEIEEALAASLADILSGQAPVGGPKVTADILNRTGSSVERNVLNSLDKRDPEVAESVRNLMFTFDDIGRMGDPEIQILHGQVDPKHQAIALKRADETFRARWLGLLPEETRAAVEAEMERLGVMRLKDVQEMQLRVVQQVRRLEEQGKVTIVRGDPDETYDTWV
jgi:flagellar motor switch protein FliG